MLSTDSVNIFISIIFGFVKQIKRILEVLAKDFGKSDLKVQFDDFKKKIMYFTKNSEESVRS